MFHMLSCFNLKPGVPVTDFKNAVAELTDFLRGENLLQSTGPLGRRQRHPVMDTDAERDQEFYFIMSFEDRAQCDRAVELIDKHESRGEEIHKSVYGRITDPIFICWEDI